MSSIHSIKIDVGIDRITQQGAAESSNFRLDKSWAAPAGVPESHVKKLFSPDTSHHLMDDLCKPQLTTWQMLMPVIHKQQRKKLLNTLEEHLVESEKQNRQNIQDAINLLEQETHDLSLLDQFRYALLPA